MVHVRGISESSDAAVYVGSDGRLYVTGMLMEGKQMIGGMSVTKWNNPMFKQGP